MKKPLAAAMFWVLLIAFSPAHAGVTMIDGGATVQNYWDEAWVTVGLGVGCFVQGCGPGTAYSVDGNATGRARVQYQPVPPAEGYDADILIRYATLTTTSYGARRMDARGAGSDGNCHAISVIDGGDDGDYVGIARAPIATLDDPNGPCRVVSLEYVPSDYGYFTIADLA